MRIGITLNEVVRDHYKTIEECYDLHIMSNNENISQDLYDGLSEENKELVSGRVEDSIHLNVDSELAEELNSKKEIELKPLKSYDLTNVSLDATDLDEALLEEISQTRERVVISVKDSEDPMGLTKLHKFVDEEEFIEFLYNEYSFEIFMRCPLTYPDVMQDLDKLYNILVKRKHTITIVSQERENSKSPSLMFLAQHQFKGNNIKWLYDYSNIWELYDLIITADPYIANTMPDKKVCLLIKTASTEEITKKGVYKFESLKEIYNYMEKNFK